MKSLCQLWLSACRPKTLPLAWMSILVGTALALAHERFFWPVALLALVTATLLQVLCNLANDYGDGLKGVDNQDRIGPQRLMQAGKVTAKQMHYAMTIVAILAVLSGVALLLASPISWVAKTLFIAFGLVSLVAALTYTLGKIPYGYIGLGDVSVLVFFGWLAVIGNYYLQGGTLHLALWLPATGCGLMAVAVLNLNNMRDIENDARCGKHTMAVRLGWQRSHYYHCALLAVACLVFALYLLYFLQAKWLVMLFFLACAPVYLHARAVTQAQSPACMAPMLPVVVGCAVLMNSAFAAVLGVQLWVK